MYNWLHCDSNADKQCVFAREYIRTHTHTNIHPKTEPAAVVVIQQKRTIYIYYCSLILMELTNEKEENKKNICKLCTLIN